MSTYFRPRNLPDALSALDHRPTRIVAGGTDFFPGVVGGVVDQDIIDITAIAELRGITEEKDCFRFGAVTRWSDILWTTLPEWMRALQWAAREVGGPQIQNAGTLGGNICNASPAADGIPALLALDARVELRSRAAMRQLPLTDFLMGNRRNALASNELMSAVLLPKPTYGARSTFIKLGSRRYLVISIAMVAACLQVNEMGHVVGAGIAVGACSAVAQRLTDLERDILHTPVASAWERVRDSHFSGLAPISDMRGDADYRRAMATGLVRDALRDLR